VSFRLHRLQPFVLNWLDEQIREQFAPLRWSAALERPAAI